MANHNFVLLFKGPARGVIINHRVFHILNDLLMNVFDLPLPRHALVDGRPRKRVSESVESVVKHIVIVDELYHVTLFELGQQLHRREHLLRLRVKEALVDVVEQLHAEYVSDDSCRLQQVHHLHLVGARWSKL